MAAQSNYHRKDLVEKLSGIVDTEDNRFDHLKHENHKQWETSVRKFCEGMNKSVDSFYSKEMKVL